MTKEYPRSDRVEEQIREVLGEALQQLKDPRIGFATVTAVKLTPDLRHAKVFVSVLGSVEEQARSFEGIRHAASHLRSHLGKQVRLRNLPFLEIVEDTTAAAGQRIEELLQQVRVSNPPTSGSLDNGPQGDDDPND